MKKIILPAIIALALIAGCKKTITQPCYVCIDKVANTFLDSISYCNGHTPPYGTGTRTLSNTYFYDNDGSNVDSTRCYQK
jgi:hypothetical protein